MHRMGRVPSVVTSLLISLSVISCSPGGDAGSRVDLLAESAIEYSTDGGASFTASPPVIGPRETVTIRYRSTFGLAGTPFARKAGLRSLVSLECDFGEESSLRWQNLTLNGVRISPPFEEVRYSTVTAIAPDLLRQEGNVLTVDLRIRNSSRQESLEFTQDISLLTLVKGDLRFQTGPMLGAYDDEFFTLTCRTNMPASVYVYRLEAGRPVGRRVSGAPVAVSEEGLVHRIRIALDRADEDEVYLVRARLDGQVEEVTVRPPVSRGDEFVFAAAGDCRTNLEDWRSVADAVAESPAELLLFAGDFVANGMIDRQWDQHFWGGGRKFLEAKPLYPIIGNHEAGSPVYDELFMSPSPDGRAHNWAQEKRGVLLIGIDGMQDWSDGSENARWLETALEDSDAKFIFLVTHFPPFSSANHGRLNEEGKPREREMRECQEVVLPLLEEYGAMALIAGHDHVYERSESPGGVTVIISGGAGAPRYNRADDAERQNPYSEVFESELHYTLFTVTGDTCVMEALTPDGRLLDTRTWTARGGR